MKHLVDTILYNPAVEVVEVDKANNKVKVIDLFNDNKMRVLNLHESKQEKGEYYFRMNKASYWLPHMFSIER